MKHLDVNFCRKQFPALNGEWVYFDNAGGTQVAKQVGKRFLDYLYHSNVQLGATYEISRQSVLRLNLAQQAVCEFMNAGDLSEIVLGPSATQLLQNLSKSLVQTFQQGDEVIVTNCDHETNTGPWMAMEKAGIVVKQWKINQDTLKLDLHDLEGLMTERTRLVAFTHTSNILGTINPVKEISKFVHERNAMVCVDGVAYAPHRNIDLQDLDVDFYVFSFYKVYGPHYSVLYCRKDILEKLPGINHFFIGRNEMPYKLQPGNINFELTYSLLGIIDYFRELYIYHGGNANDGIRKVSQQIFDPIAGHEEEVSAPLIEFLRNKKGVRILGEKTASKEIRVPTISFVSDKFKSDEIPVMTDPHKIGIRYGDFYARRLIDDLGLSEKNGVVRVSMVHYNALHEVNRLIEILDGNL